MEQKVEGQLKLANATIGKTTKEMLSEGWQPNKTWWRSEVVEDSKFEKHTYLLHLRWFLGLLADLIFKYEINGLNTKQGH